MKCCPTCGRFDKTLADIECAHCGTSFHPRYASSRFCSASCRIAGRRQLPDRPCGHCVTTFQPSHRGQKFCSRPCADGARAPSSVGCGHCGNPFKPRDASSTFCSQECHRSWRKRHMKTPRPPRTDVWTEEHVEIVRVGIQCGKSRDQIAAEVGRTRSAVNHIVMRRGLTRKGGRVRYSDEVLRWAAKNHKTDPAATAIVRQLLGAGA